MHLTSIVKNLNMACVHVTYYNQHVKCVASECCTAAKHKHRNKNNNSQSLSAEDRQVVQVGSWKNRHWACRRVEEILMLAVFHGFRE